MLRGSFSAPKAEPWNRTCGCLPCGPCRGRSDPLPSSPQDHDPSQISVGLNESFLPRQVGEYVDARDTNMGAWFEAKVIRVTRKAQAHDQPSSSSSKPEDDIIYHVKYDE